MPVPPEILAIAQQLQSGETPSQQTVRTFLGWFGAAKRGYKIVQRIRADLETAGVRTDPDFESAYIDGHMQFVAPPPLEAAPATTTVSVSAVVVTSSPAADASGLPTTPLGDPTYRLSRLRAANNKPIFVAPDASLEEAVTKMMTNDFSQLPVMTSEREVKGAVSWRSLGKRLALGVTCATARDCMDPVTVVDHDMSIFDAISVIVATDFVLVRRADRVLGGIVTTSDLGAEFGRLGEPFLLLGEIENHLRWLLSTRFAATDLEACLDPADTSRSVEGPEDLTLGEIQRFLDNNERWQQLNLALHRVEFIKTLDAVRQIRNGAMHFDPDGVLPEDVERLREFVKFMRALQSLGWS
jgi:CBS domain-containing protein